MPPLLMSNKPIVLLCLAGALGAVWWALRNPPETPQPPAPDAPAPAEKPPTPMPPPQPVAVALTFPKVEQVPENERLSMPDGSFVPTLNGVKNPAKIAWGEFPYSPVVRIQKDPTLDWYVHADGTYTTTIMQWRSDLGREDPVTLCLHPAQATAVEAPDEASGPPKR
ncbi:MAG: hypothetical protein JNK49_06235 [Planctomycetes bacterium]|nr:hypothetical protein [Planctomycetota bacterium]